jgi:hypothetical protein
MSKGENVRKKEIYSSIKRLIPPSLSSSDVEMILKKMQKNAHHYESLLNPTKEVNDLLSTQLMAINDIKALSCRPLILKLYEARDENRLTEQDLVKCSVILESYLMRHYILNLANNSFQIQFIKICESLEKDNPCDIYSWLENELKKGTGSVRWVNDGEFERSLLYDSVYERGVLKYFLTRIEEDFAHKERADLSATTVEHIMPRTLTDDWKTSLGQDYQQIYDKYINTLGNLTLSGYNSELSNLPFSEKKLRLETSNLELNRWIARKENWAEKEIIERGKSIIEKAIKIWPYPK